MKTAQKLFSISLFLLLVAGCVTTRSELNEKRGLLGGGNDSATEETENRSSVKSEDLNSEQPAVTENSKPAPVVATPVQKNSEYALEEMRAEMAKLSGKIDELEQDKKANQAAQAEEQAKLQTKIAELEKQLKEKEDENKAPQVPEGKTPLQAAKDAYFASHYETAIQYLDSFLKNNEKGKEAEEGYFFRAESNFKLKQYKKAIVDYSKFPEKFPKSNFGSKALLKIAESFEALEMKEDAKAFYQDLFEKYPKTVEGKLAKKKLSGKSSKK